MKLIGEVTLDKESMENLKESVRSDVIADIKSDSLYSEEVKKYLNECDPTSYVKIIESTIDNVLDSIVEDDIAFKSDKRAFKQLSAIRSLLKI